MRRLLIALAMFVLAATPAAAERLALVIGNAGYEHTAPLATPRADAYAFSDFLRVNDFRVTEVIDASRDEMSVALEAFIAALGKDDTAVFYYAGHGLQVDETNYLMGVDARFASSFDVASETVALSEIVGQMEARAGAVMVFIDACRDNPLAARLASATRGLAVGLAPLEVRGEGTMVAFAATPGQVAYDGEGNSPFTKALIDNLGEDGLEVATAFKRVIRDVRAATGDRQVPQLVSTMSVEFYFHVAQPLAQGVVLEPMDEPAPVEPAVPQTPGTVAAAAPQAVPAPAPEPTEMERDAAAATRIGTLRAVQLFLLKYRWDPIPWPLVEEMVAAVGTRTRLAGISPPALEAALQLDGTARRAIQRLLAAKGFDPGGIDGAFGPATRRQIAAFQKDAGEPDTGYLTLGAAVRLGLPIPRTVSATSGPAAKSFNVADLKRLETDPRIIRAIECLSGRFVTYGVFEDHVYVAVTHAPGSVETLAREAERCGGYLVTITSKAENDFVFSLFRDDPRFLDVGFDNQSGWIGGPLIGLAQKKGSREPAGGWTWPTGEPLSFSAWGPHQPDNYQGREHFAHYWTQLPLSAKGSGNYAPRPVWNDTPAESKYIMEID